MENVKQDRPAKVGQHVIFCDSSSVDHDALVTVVHGVSCVNLLVVSDDPTKQDQYGRQIERYSSVVRMADHTAHGYYYRFLDEEKKAYAKPLEQ